jgi:hypothetical protein
MSFANPVRRRLTLAAFAGAAILASCAPSPPPAPPPPPPPVGMSSQLIELASAYRAYLNRATAISPTFTSGQQVADSLRIAEGYQAQQLLQGAVVYGAVAALQDQSFVAGVRKYAADPAQRQQVAYEIMRNPNYVSGIDGAASAAGLVQAALGGDGRKLLDIGRRMKQDAYDVQKSAWSKGEVAGRDARLAQAKQLGATPDLSETDETTRLQQASVGATSLGLTPAMADPPFTPLVAHSLAVAALAALGYADDAHVQQVTPLLTDPDSGSCLNLAKLNLYQCLAVAKPHYEDIFCLGQHVMEDTGACLMKRAGVAVPPDPMAETAAQTKPAKSPTKSSKGSKSRHGKR